MIEFYWDGGFTFTGLSAERPHDILGIGLAYRGVSSETSAFQKSMGDTIIAEAMLEVSYTAQIVPGFTIQPDFQYFWTPAGTSPIRSTRRRPCRTPWCWGCARPSTTEARRPRGQRAWLARRSCATPGA